MPCDWREFLKAFISPISSRISPIREMASQLLCLACDQRSADPNLRGLLAKAPSPLCSQCDETFAHVILCASGGCCGPLTGRECVEARRGLVAGQHEEQGVAHRWCGKCHSLRLVNTFKNSTVKSCQSCNAKGKENYQQSKETKKKRQHEQQQHARSDNNDDRIRQHPSPLPPPSSSHPDPRQQQEGWPAISEESAWLYRTEVAPLKTIEHLPEGPRGPSLAILGNAELLSELDERGVMQVQSAGVSMGNMQDATLVCPNMRLEALGVSTGQFERNGLFRFLITPCKATQVQGIRSPLAALASVAVAAAGGAMMTVAMFPLLRAWKSGGPGETYDNFPTYAPPIAPPPPHSGNGAGGGGGGAAKKSRKEPPFPPSSSFDDVTAMTATISLGQAIQELVTAHRVTSAQWQSVTLAERELEFWSGRCGFHAIYPRDIQAVPKPKSVNMSAWSPWSWNTAQLQTVLKMFSKKTRHGVLKNGVQTPWFYITTMFSYFCWHIEVKKKQGGASFVNTHPTRD
jgi:DNA-directed RNA polymerase subunit M/transcription elongation factor TFIIS